MNSNGLDTSDVLQCIPFDFEGFGLHRIVHGKAEISIGSNLGLSQMVITQFRHLFSINFSHVF